MINAGGELSPQAVLMLDAESGGNSTHRCVDLDQPAVLEPRRVRGPCHVNYWLS